MTKKPEYFNSFFQELTIDLFNKAYEKASSGKKWSDKIKNLHDEMKGEKNGKNTRRDTTKK